jgi:hypothetical protein
MGSPQATVQEGETLNTVTNEEYYERWEAARLKPVDSHMTPEQIQASQGTRLSEDAPWETYAKELLPDEDPAMLAAIEEYASRVSDAAPSSQTADELCRLREAADVQSRMTQTESDA